MLPNVKFLHCVPQSFVPNSIKSFFEINEIVEHISLAVSNFFNDISVGDLFSSTSVSSEPSLALTKHFFYSRLYTSLYYLELVLLKHD